MNSNAANAALEAAAKAIELVLRNEVSVGGDRWDDAVTTITTQMVSDFSPHKITGCS